MRALGLTAWILWIFGSPLGAWAQGASQLGAPPPERARPPAIPGAGGAAQLGTPPSVVAVAEAADAEPADRWGGPRVELGYSVFTLPDGYDGGTVHAAIFGGYLPTSFVRIGAWAEAGVREYALGNDDMMVRASLAIGYQHLDWQPLVPYLAAVGSVGLVFGQRFHTPESWAFSALGAELGADLRLVGPLWFGLSLSYLRGDLQGVGVDLWVFRARIGL